MAHKLYRLAARADCVEALKVSLQDLAAKIRLLDGCDGVDIFRVDAEPATFLFLERWTSLAHRDQGGKALGKSAFAPVTACLAAPPELQNLSAVSDDR